MVNWFQADSIANAQHKYSSEKQQNVKAISGENALLKWLFASQDGQIKINVLLEKQTRADLHKVMVSCTLVIFAVQLTVLKRMFIN